MIERQKYKKSIRSRLKTPKVVIFAFEKSGRGKLMKKTEK